MTAAAPRRSDAVAVLVAGAFFMENLDGTVIATALPSMARSFGTEPATLGIGMTAYLLTLAVFIPASGWAADRFGAKRVFVCAVAVFTLASILCGLSQGRGEFVAARILQGIGGAMMTPVGRLVVLRGTPKSELVRAIAVLTWPALVAPVLGPPIGGFIASAPPLAGIDSWRWIFLLNVPLGAAALAMALRLIPGGAGEVPRRFDTRGFLLNGAALVTLLYGLDLLGSRNGDLEPALLVLAASGLLIWLAIGHARRTPAPLVGLGALAVPSFRVSMRAGGLSRIAISTLPFLLPLLFQVALDFSIFTSGLLMLWYGLSNLAIKPATTPILRRFGFRTVLIANTLVNAAAIAGCALIGPQTPMVAIAALLLLAGASRSMQFTAFNTLAFSDVPPERTAEANTLFNMAFQLAVGMGITLGATVLRGTVALLGGAPGGHLPVLAFEATFLLVAVVSLAALPDIVRLSLDTGHAVTGHRPARSAVADGRSED